MQVTHTAGAKIDALIEEDEDLCGKIIYWLEDLDTGQKRHARAISLNPAGEGWTVPDYRVAIERGLGRVALVHQAPQTRELTFFDILKLPDGIAEIPALALIRKSTLQWLATQGAKP